MTNNEPAPVERWHTRDGVVLILRPIAPSDFAIEKHFIAGLSTTTGYRRLLSPRIPQDDEIARFTDIDGIREVAWIAVTVDGPESMCGVARYVRNGSSAEWAWCWPTHGSDAVSARRCWSG